MDTLKTDDLLIRVDRSGAFTIRLDWTGRSNSRDPGQVILPFFDEVLKEASTESRAIEMHFEVLEHFNSSTIAALIQLINLAGRARVPLRIHYDAALNWQVLSFDALKRALRPFSGGDAANNVDFVEAGR